MDHRGTAVCCVSFRMQCAGVLAFKCGPVFAALTGGTLVVYTLFTFGFTQVCADTHFRQTAPRTSAPKKMVTNQKQKLISHFSSNKWP